MHEWLSRTAHSTLVLVHGGRQGGWSWTRVAPRLRAAGCDVWTPTLSGLADRGHLLAPSIDLDVHVEDVRALLEYEDLSDVVLVGHSYGGMVITALCQTDARPRIGALVYLDALIPEPGETAYDLMAPEITANLRASVARDGDGWRVPARMGNGVFGLTDPGDLAWASARLSDQPAATYTAPLRSDAAARTLPRTFIRFTAPPVIPDAVVDRARRNPSWRYAEVAAPHAGSLSHPDEVARALLDAISDRQPPARPTSPAGPEPREEPSRRD
jgi:pimeloyl-ACP methyl ester carboxylesterase